MKYFTIPHSPSHMEEQGSDIQTYHIHTLTDSFCQQTKGLIQIQTNLFYRFVIIRILFLKSSKVGKVFVLQIPDYCRQDSLPSWFRMSWSQSQKSYSDQSQISVVTPLVVMGCLATLAQSVYSVITAEKISFMWWL